MSKKNYVNKIYSIINYSRTAVVDESDPDYKFIYMKIDKINESNLDKLYEEIIDLSTKRDIQTGISRRDFNLIVNNYIEKQENDIWTKNGYYEYLEMIPDMLKGVYWEFRGTKKETHECIEIMIEKDFLMKVKYNYKFLDEKVQLIFDAIDKKQCLEEMVVKGTTFIRDKYILKGIKTLVTKEILDKKIKKEKILENKNDAINNNSLVISGSNRSLKIAKPKRF